MEQGKHNFSIPRLCLQTSAGKKFLVMQSQFRASAPRAGRKKLLTCLILGAEGEEEAGNSCLAGSFHFLLVSPRGTGQKKEK